MSKKISYKDQRLTEAQQKKSKAINSAGIKNYLGEQENVTVPKKWLSSPDHVVAELAYITPREQKILLDADLYGSLNGEPNRGPGGIMSLQGAGDGGGVSSDGKGGHTGTGGQTTGTNTTGPGPQGDFRTNAQHTGLKGDYSRDRTVTGDTSAFDFNNRTQTYELSKKAKNKDAVKDFLQGKYDYQAGKKPSFWDSSNAYGLKTRNQIYNSKRNLANIDRLQKMRMNKIQYALKNMKDFPGFIDDDMSWQDAFEYAPSFQDPNLALAGGKRGLTQKTINDILSGKRSNIDFASPSGLPSAIGFATDQLGKIMGGPITRERLQELKSEYDTLGSLNPAEQTTFGLMEKYEPNRYKQQFGPPEPGNGDGQQPYLPINYNTGAATIEAVEPYTNDFTYRFGDDQNVIYDQYGSDGYRTTAAEGGIMGTRARRAMGGIMNRVDQRQQFFLGGIGKAIGKVAKAAGKVLSSDVGKMALAGAAFYYGGGGTFAPGGSSTFSPGTFFSRKNPLLFSSKIVDGVSKQVFNPLKFAGLTTLGGALAGPAKVDQMPGDDGAKGGRLKDSRGNEVIPSEIRAEIDEAYESGDPEQIKRIEDYYAFLSPTEQYLPYSNYGSQGYRTTVATGGRIRAEEGGLMNLGGMEKDYRAEGGFVPIGKQEKADDVPARLSVNEFVFTADAVRNAGSGDIDKGAEVMENMMKNLENGGTVSEESQGNTGAQNMFSVSERIGEVI